MVRTIGPARRRAPSPSISGSSWTSRVAWPTPSRRATAAVADSRTGSTGSLRRSSRNGSTNSSSQSASQRTPASRRYPDRSKLSRAATAAACRPKSALSAPRSAPSIGASERRRPR
jgi:hypothetical protein